MHKDIPHRVLFLLVILWAVSTLFAGVKLGFGGAVLSIAIIPLLILFYQFPIALIASGIFGGTNFYRIITYLAHIETAYVLYSLLALAIVVGGFFVFIKDKKGRFNFKVGLPEILLSLIFIVALLGLLHTKNPRYGIIKTGSFFVNVLIPFFVIQLFRGDSAGVKRLLNFGIVVMIPATVLAVATLLMGGGARWARFSVAGAGPVGFADGMALAVLLSLLVLENSRSRDKQIAVSVFGVLSLWVLVTAATRAPVLSLVLAYSIHTVLFSKLPRSRRIILFVIFAIAVGFFAMKVSTFLLYRFVSLRGVEMSALGRTMLWRTSMQHLTDAPIIGLGTGSFRSILYSGGKATGLEYPHNLFLEYYLEWGIIGLGLFVSFLGTVALRAYRALRNPSMPEEQKTLLGNTVVLTLYSLSTAMVSGDFTNRTLYVFSGLVLAMSYIQPARKETDAHSDVVVGSSAF
ncbi:O-antigen ligase family protein [bacterium]|nr:O-antigen ligase family protein [bacterium]